MSTVETFEKIKKEIERTKSRKSEVTGEINVLLRQLKTEHKANNLEEGQKKLRGLLATKEKLNTQFDDIVSKLEDAYEW